MQNIILCYWSRYFKGCCELALILCPSISGAFSLFERRESHGSFSHRSIDRYYSQEGKLGMDYDINLSHATPRWPKPRAQGFRVRSMYQLFMDCDSLAQFAKSSKPLICVSFNGNYFYVIDVNASLRASSRASLTYLYFSPLLFFLIVNFLLPLSLLKYWFFHQIPAVVLLVNDGLPLKSQSRMPAPKCGCWNPTATPQGLKADCICSKPLGIFGPWC